MHVLTKFGSWLVFLLLLGCAGGCVSRLGQPEVEARLLVADTAVERGQYPWAVHQYRMAAQAGSRELAERAARMAFDNLQDGELLAIASEWLARDPKNEVARRFKAVALLQLDRRSAAVSEFAILVKTAYASPAEAFLALRETLTETSNEAGAAAIVGLLANQYPGIAEAAYAHATLALNAGDSTTALRVIQTAVTLKPRWREARWVQARSYVAAGDCESGLSAARGLAAESADTEQLNYAWLLIACGRAVQARPLFENLARGRLHIEALNALASIDVDSHRYDEALKEYSELAETGHNTEQALFGLAVIADRRHEVERAAHLYMRVTTGPRAVAAQLRAYRLLQEAGDRDGAARMLDQVILSQPSIRVPLTAGRAQVLAEIGRSSEALALLQRAQAMYPDRAELADAKAIVLEKMGDLPGALITLRAVLRARPNDPSAQNALGFMLADHVQNLDSAERLIKAAHAQVPDSAAVCDSLGWVMFRRGDGAGALRWLQSAYAKERDSEIAVHLATVEWAQGEQSAAKALVLQALELAPGDKRLEALRVRFGVVLP